MKNGIMFHDCFFLLSVWGAGGETGVDREHRPSAFGSRFQPAAAGRRLRMPCERCGRWALHGYWTVGAHRQESGDTQHFWVVECLPSCEANAVLLDLQAFWNEHQAALSPQHRESLAQIVIHAQQAQELLARREYSRRRAAEPSNASEVAPGYSGVGAGAPQFGLPDLRLVVRRDASDQRGYRERPGGHRGSRRP